MALVKCEECGNEISSKADACPKCGVKLKAKPAGCIVSLFKLVGAIIGLMVAVSFLSNSSEKKNPVQELESRCREVSDSYSVASERANVYSSCVEAGMSTLKSRGVN